MDLLLLDELLNKEEWLVTHLQTWDYTQCCIKACTWYATMLTQFRSRCLTQPPFWIRTNDIEVSSSVRSLISKAAIKWCLQWDTPLNSANLRIMTAISAFLDFEKSKMMSSAIFLALPYGLIGNCTRQFQLKIFFLFIFKMSQLISLQRIWNCRSSSWPGEFLQWWASSPALRR